MGGRMKRRETDVGRMRKRGATPPAGMGSSNTN